MRHSLLVVVTALLYQIQVVGVSLPNEVRVSKIESKSLAPSEAKELAQTLRIQIGKNLDLGFIDREIKKVFSGGRFGDVRVYFDREKNGRYIVFVEGVRLRKLGKIDWSEVDEKIRGETGVEKMLVSGQKVNPSELRSVGQKIKTALEEDGYSDAQVEYEMKPTSEDGGNDLKFVVTKKERILISEIRVRGIDDDLAEAVRSRIKIREGDFLDRLRIEKSVQAVTEYLFANQYPSAKVKWITEKTETNMNAVRLLFDVTVGQRYRFLIKGNEVFETGVIRSVIGFDVLGQSDSANKIRKAVEDKYRLVGYHFVQVDVDVGTVSKEGIITVSIQISEGPKVLVDSVVFDGLLTERIGNPSNIFFENASGVLRRRVFWEEGLEESTRRFVKNIRDRGFLSASVTGPRVFFSEDRKGVQLFYDLQLGNLYEVRRITFKGNENVSTEKLKEVLSFGVGDTLNRDVLKGSVDAVKARVQSSGFLDAKVRA
ncbi:MAG: POTRA domain-containing protein, partial [Pseudomonadota bacterium]